MPDADILIIGGGAAGLSAAGALKYAGPEATILDGGGRVGQSWEKRYERLHLHTVRDYSGLAQFPIPRAYPKYLSKDQYAAYLREYAAHFDLKIMPGTHVRRVRQAEKGGRSGWVAETEAETWFGRAVVIATGQFSLPVYPDLPGLADYRGEKMHSAEYKSGKSFQGRSVLVIGAGNSGLEIAADLAEQGAQRAAVSVRSGPPVVPRDFMGVPAQVFGIWMHPFPPALSDRIGRMLSRLALGDLTRYGFPQPEWGAFSSRRVPVIDVGFAAALKAGKVEVRPAVTGFTQNGVVYHDGRIDVFDVVIFATGFKSGLQGLLEPEGLLDGNGRPQFHSGERTSCPGLYFMGFYDSLRGFLYESNLAARRLVAEIKANMS